MIESAAQTLFDPVVIRARAELRERLGQTLHNEIPSGVFAGWEAHLLKRLSIAGAKATSLQFQVFRTARAAFTVPDAGGVDEAAAIRDFVAQPEKRLRQLFTEFPLLEHLFETLVQHWVETVEEFLARFSSDRDIFPTWFGETFAALPADVVEPGLSDPHHRGRTVARVRFTNGSMLIYKPRSLVSEVHYKGLLDFVNGLGCPKPLQSAESVDRGAYGWMEKIGTRPCNRLSEVESFYWRSGALLGLVFLAGGVDMHRENLIAAGEHPVLIDLETLIHPQNEAGTADHPDNNSILRTGFLPTARIDLKPVQTSALCRNSQLERGNDNLSHIPVVDGRQVAATDFTESVAQGFEWIGDALLRDCAVALQFASRLRKLCSYPQRRILRSSVVYSRMLDELFSPQHLRRRVSPDSVVKQLSKGSAPPLNDEEIVSLGDLDFPYFTQEKFAESSTTLRIELPTHETFRAQRRLIVEALVDR